MIKTDTGGFVTVLDELLKDYKDLISNATEEGLDDAAKIFIRNARAMSPRRSGKYARSWKVKKTKYKYRRYIGNTMIVKGKKFDTIPLINVLEYSTVRDNKHVQKIFDASAAEMANAIANRLKGTKS